MGHTLVFTGSKDYMARGDAYQINELIESVRRLIRVEGLSQLDLAILRVKNDNLQSSIMPMLIIIYRDPLAINRDFGEISIFEAS